MTFEIKLIEEFKNYINSLNINKKSILISKLSLFENTGFLGNCKALGNNIFEYKIDTIKSNNIYYYINDNKIIFFNELSQKENLNNMSNTTLVDFNKLLLNDIKYAKSFYKEINDLYKQTGEENFFIDQLKVINEIQKDNFKQIVGFNYDNIESLNKDIITLEDLKNKLNFIIKLKSIEYIVEKTKINKEDIEKLLKIKENINLINLVKLMKL